MSNISNPKGIEKVKELERPETEIERQKIAREELEKLEIQKTELARKIAAEETERLKTLIETLED